MIGESDVGNPFAKTDKTNKLIDKGPYFKSKPLPSTYDLGLNEQFMNVYSGNSNDDFEQTIIY